MGASSLAIKDMSGLLKPYAAFELITLLKKNIKIPIYLHTHATTGMADATNLKAYEAGVDNIDTCLLYTSPSPRDRTRSRMPSSA